jgi:hypothetical protein
MFFHPSWSASIENERAIHVTVTFETSDSIGLFIYSTKTSLRENTPPRLGPLAPDAEVAGGHTLPLYKGHGRPLLKWKGRSSDPVTFEAETRWPKRGGVFPRRHVFAE